MNYHILEKIEQKMYIHLNSQQQKALHDVLVECLNEEEEKNNDLTQSQNSSTESLDYQESYNEWQESTSPLCMNVDSIDGD